VKHNVAQVLRVNAKGFRELNKPKSDKLRRPKDVVHAFWKLGYLDNILYYNISTFSVCWYVWINYK